MSGIGPGRRLDAALAVDRALTAMHAVAERIRPGESIPHAQIPQVRADAAQAVDGVKSLRSVMPRTQFRAARDAASELAESARKGRSNTLGLRPAWIASERVVAGHDALVAYWDDLRSDGVKMGALAEASRVWRNVKNRDLTGHLIGSPAALAGPRLLKGPAENGGAEAAGYELALRLGLAGAVPRIEATSGAALIQVIAGARHSASSARDLERIAMIPLVRGGLADAPARSQARAMVQVSGLADYLGADPDRHLGNLIVGPNGDQWYRIDLGMLGQGERKSVLNPFLHPQFQPTTSVRTANVLQRLVLLDLPAREHARRALGSHGRFDEAMDAVRRASSTVGGEYRSDRYIQSGSFADALRARLQSAIASARYEYVPTPPDAG
jgi:hypothetical protein